jgi:hypothetical protein
LGQEGPGQGDQLAFTGGQGLPPLVDHGVDAGGHAGDHVGQPHLVHGLVDLLVGGRGPGEGDVVPDGPGEEEGFLGHHAELAA